MHLFAYPVVLPGQHLLGEKRDDRREVRLLVEFLVALLRPRGCAAATTPESSAAQGPARRRCAVLASTIWRQCGYRSVLVATTAPTGQISWAWRRNRISGSVNSWLVSLTPSASRRRRAAVRAWPTGAAGRDRPRRGCRRTPARPCSSGLGALDLDPQYLPAPRPAARGAGRSGCRRSGSRWSPVVSARRGRDDDPGRRLFAVGDDRDERGASRRRRRGRPACSAAS